MNDLKFITLNILVVIFVVCWLFYIGYGINGLYGALGVVACGITLYRPFKKALKNIWRASQNG